jgi:hypothetical protein
VTGPISFTARVREVLEDALTGAIWSQRLGECMVDQDFRPRPPIGRPRLEVRS